MAKKKKRAKPTMKKGPAKKKAAKRKVAGRRFYSDFERDFRSFLKEPGDPKKRPWSWPPPGQLPAVSFGEIAQVLNLLAAAYIASTPPAAGMGATFLDRVATRVHNYGWPQKPPGTSSSHLYEISRVVDTMLEAVNWGGGGGGGWPPGRPK